MARTSKSGHEYFVILIDERHTAISWYVGGDSLVVLSKLHADTLSHGRVRLLGLNTDLLDDDSGGVRSSSEGLLPFGVLVSLLVAEISPSNSRIARLYLLFEILTY